MRFTLSMGLGGYQHYQTIAPAAEESGWTSVCIPDSIFFPSITESEYPYLDTDTVRQALDGVPVIEPFVAMAQMAAVTKTLRFYPAVLKVPVRQPLILAKSLSSLAVVSGNRIALGAGLSPWKEDFTYNGVDFERRGKLLDECIAIIRGAMSGDYFEYASDNYQFGPMKLSPVPERPVPILIGGHAKPALRRAARLGDGWISANAEFDELQGMIGELDAFRAEYGSAARDDFEVHVSYTGARSLDELRGLDELGVTDICIAPWNAYDPGLDLQGKLDSLRRFAEDVIQHW
ncbi:MAG: TIGR03619 family F420-dependent LLM class oxidoreductase [Halioglobus sp.]|nr:TIGR03619 family F420-dependent LLM class oxidoreductase [Halioglobus sp.]